MKTTPSRSSFSTFRTFGRAFVALLVSILAGSSIAAESPALSERDAERITRAVARAVPGDFYVILSQGDEIYVDATKENGAELGKRYVVERLGAELSHPVTGEKLGRARERIAEVEITWLGDGFSKARVLDRKEAPLVRLKDLVRPASPPALLYLPVLEESGRRSRLTELLDAEIVALLGSNASIKVEEGEAAGPAPSSYVAAARKAGKRLIVVTGRVASTGRLELGVVQVPKAKVVEAFEFEIEPEAKALLGAAAQASAGSGGASEPARPAAASSAPVSAPSPGIATRPGEASTIAIPLDFAPEAGALADIDGDGIDEIVIGEERAVRVGSVTPEGAFVEKAKIKSGFYGVIEISGGDIDGDGKDEIYVTEKPDGHFRSRGFRYSDGKFTSIDSLNNVILRAVREPNGDILYGQEYGHSRPFIGKVRRYRILEDEFEREDADLPEEITVFDFVRTGDRIASIGPENRLRVYDESKREIMRSIDPWGGSNRWIESADKRNKAELRIGLRAWDLAGVEGVEVLAVQNVLDGGLGGGFIRLGNIQQYVSGRVAALSTRSGRIEEVFTTHKVPGEIRGLDVGTFRASRPEIFFLAVESLSLFKKQGTIHIVPLP